MSHIHVRHPFGAASRSKSAVLPICRTGGFEPTPFHQKKGPFQGPMIFGGEGGIDSAHPCASPLRGRFAVQIGCPADLSNR